MPGTRLAAAIPAPPVTGDWRHAEIFDAIARDAGGRHVPATVSIVPNHPYFSTSNFRYYAVRDDRPLRIERAWDDLPVGVRYMVLKSGDVGPPWTESKSRRAMAKLADDPDFARAFPVIAELPLPDGSTATVRARHLAAGVDAHPDAMAAKLVTAVTRALEDVARDVAGLDVRVTHGGRIGRGDVERLDIVVRRAAIGELRKPGAALLTVDDLHLVVEDLVVNPWTLWQAGRFDPLDARRIRLASATIRADALQAFLANLKGYSGMTVRLERDALVFDLRVPGPDVSGRVRVMPGIGQPFTMEADGVRVGGIRVPGILIDWVFRNLDPSGRIADRLPVPVELAALRVTEDAIRIKE
jgi:hypothetical protein